MPHIYTCHKYTNTTYTYIHATYIYTPHIYTCCICTYIHTPHIYIYTRHIYIHATYMYITPQIYIHTTYIHIHSTTNIYIYIHVTYTYIHATCIHIYIHTHTHINTVSLNISEQTFYLPCKLVFSDIFPCGSLWAHRFSRHGVTVLRMGMQAQKVVLACPYLECLLLFLQLVLRDRWDVGKLRLRAYWSQEPKPASSPTLISQHRKLRLRKSLPPT